MKKFLNFRYPFYCFLALLFGAVVAKSLYAGVVETIIIVGVALLFVAIMSVCYRKFLPLLMIIVFFFVGNGAFFLGMTSFDNREYEGEVAVVGRVTDTLFTSEENYSNVLLEDVSIDGEKAKNVRLFVYGNGDVEVGDILAFSSTVEAVKPFNLGVFNLTSYRNKIGYSSSVNFSDIVITEGNMKIDEAFRSSVKEALLGNMSERNAFIAYAVLFGDQSGIDDEVDEVYRNSGIVHVLTVSGLHIAFIVGALMLLLKLFKGNKFLSLTIISIVLLFYCYLCGFTPSVVRATIMAIVLLLSRICNRPYDGLNSLAIAGFVIVCFSPLSTVDVGFLMSFFCVMFILLLAKPFTKLLSFVMPRKVASVMAVSISAQIGILPFTASFFSSFNFLSVFANLLVIPIFSIIFPALFVLAFLLSFMPFLGPVLVVFDYAFDLVFIIASFFSSTTLQVPLKPFSLSISTLIVIFFFTLSSFFVVKGIGRLLVCSCVAFMLVLSLIIPYLPTNNFTSVSFVESYSGEMIVLTSKDGGTLYYGDDYYYQTFFSQDRSYAVDYYLSESINLATADIWKDYGAEVLLSLDADSSDESQYSVSETPLQVGAFRVSYKEGAFIVEFDGKKVLICEKISTSSLFDLINEDSYDIIYLDDNSLSLEGSFLVVGDGQRYDSGKENFTFYGEELAYRGID